MPAIRCCTGRGEVLRQLQRPHILHVQVRYCSSVRHRMNDSLNLFANQKVSQVTRIYLGLVGPNEKGALAEAGLKPFRYPCNITNRRFSRHNKVFRPVAAPHALSKDDRFPRIRG